MLVTDLADKTCEINSNWSLIKVWNRYWICGDNFRYLTVFFIILRYVNYSNLTSPYIISITEHLFSLFSIHTQLLFFISNFISPSFLFFLHWPENFFMQSQADSLCCWNQRNIVTEKNHFPSFSFLIIWHSFLPKILVCFRKICESQHFKESFPSQ